MRTRSLKKNINAGSTLLEIILYVSMVGMFMYGVSNFLTIVLQAQIKNQVIAEVEQGGMENLIVITQALRNSEAINTPSVGSSASSISLGMVLPSQNPTVFNVASGTLRVAAGGGSFVDLTSSRVIISDLNFLNVSRSGTPGAVRVSFTLTYNNISGRNEYSYRQNFVGTATLRP